MRALALSALIAFPAHAGEVTWLDISATLYGDRPLADAGRTIAIDAPYRSDNDARTRIAAEVVGAKGRLLDKVTLVIDENPMPVSAVFQFTVPQTRFHFDVTMRINGPTPIHVVAETTDGGIWVAEAFVKTSGQGACSAPPGTDPNEALATLGNMVLEVLDPTQTGRALDALTALTMGDKQLDVDIQHPSHSGMQMDQISLLFIPMRYIEDVQIDLDGKSFVDLSGSISLSENPRITMSIPAATRSVDVTMTDTSGTVSRASKSLPGF